MTLYEQKENSLPSFFDDDRQNFSSPQLNTLSPPPTSMSTSTSFLNDFLSINNDVQNLSSSMSIPSMNNSSVTSQNVPSSRPSLIAKVPPPPSFNQQVQQQYQPQTFSSSQMLPTLSYQPVQNQPLQNITQNVQNTPQHQPITLQSASTQSQLNAITKLSETLEKFMAGVDQRLEALEKTTREILVYQKTQKDFFQQQCTQLSAKINELVESREKAEKKETFSSHQTTSTTSTTKSAREIEKEREREQELADAQLAAQLQSQLDQETRVQPQVQPREPEEHCPLCNLKFPVAVLEKHCNDVHFNADGGQRLTQDQLNRMQTMASQPQQEQSWLAKWFGTKTETQQSQQTQQQPPRPNQPLMATTSSPALQPYLLAPGYVQNPQQPVMFRPGQIPPGYSQVYYDSTGNVYNPNPNPNSSRNTNF